MYYYIDGVLVVQLQQHQLFLFFYSVHHCFGYSFITYCYWFIAVFLTVLQPGSVAYTDHFM